LFVMKKRMQLFLGLLLLVTIPAAQAGDVVSIRPAHEVATEPNELLNDILPESEQDKPAKKKRRWFKNWKGDILEKKFNKLFPELQFDSLKCDVIVLKSGEEIEARILEVNTGAIVYELCAQDYGPRRTLLISKVFMVKYKDGYKEVFKSSSQNDSIERQRSGPDKAAFVIGLLLGFMLGLLGVLLAYVIYRKDDYSRKKATRGALVGILALVLLYLYLLSIV
jgi:hypothetical protein